MTFLTAFWEKIKQIWNKMTSFLSSLFKKQSVPVQANPKPTPPIEIPPKESLVPKAAELVIDAQKLMNNPNLSTHSHDELRRLMWYVMSYIDPYKTGQPANYDRKVEDWLLLLQQEIEEAKENNKGPSPSR